MTAEQELRSLLPRLDVVIEREVFRLRARYQLSLDEFRGLYVSDAQIDALLRQSGITPDVTVPPHVSVEGQGRWAQLIQRFSLDDLESNLLLLALAGDIDSRYPTLFAYLHDDVTHRKPSVDLALRLWGDDWKARAAIRDALSPGSRLIKSGLLEMAPASGAICQTPFSVAPLAVHFLLGLDARQVAGLAVEIAETGPDPDSIAVAAFLAAEEDQPVLVLAGRDGTGRRAFAAQTAAALGQSAAVHDLALRTADDLGKARLACRLHGARLIILANETPGEAVLSQIVKGLNRDILAVADCVPWERALAGRPRVVRWFAIASVVERQAQWKAALRAAAIRVPNTAIDQVATRFKLSQGLIERTVRDVRVASLAPAGTVCHANAAKLIDAARAQCAINLGHLATQVSARPGWDDLVLPPGVLEQLRDFASAAAQRDRVFGLWGMGEVGRGVGNGVAALFSGASGTGKTMSAAVIARAVGLDLWRIDLSSVVSKYIGETEKNLDRIFTGARDGDAILFFDEADALFGKRSEVKDAHDRYANVEVAYLLQKLEEYDGISILASNFSRNIDQAFVRRLNYIIEFPLPDEKLRQRLWRKAFSVQAPIKGEIDHAYLGGNFVLSGGDIRSAALDAAFLAAGDGTGISMQHIIRSVSRQMLKQGRLPGRSDLNDWGVSSHGLSNGAAP